MSNRTNKTKSDKLISKNRDIVRHGSREINPDYWEKERQPLELGIAEDSESDEYEQNKQVRYNMLEYSNMDNEQIGGKTKNDDTKRPYDNYRRFIGRATYADDNEQQLANNKIPIGGEIKMTKIPDILNMDPNPILHTDINYPKFSLGFYHWIHATKNKTQIFDRFAGKKKAYHVINPYERYIDNYDKSIGEMTKKYFDLRKKPDILSRAFYKLWEILYYYDLIDIKSSNFRSAHLAEGPGSFIQAVMFFREKYSTSAKTDKYYAITIHGETEDESLDLEKYFTEYYSSEKPQRVIIHKTYNAKISRNSKTKDNGDLTKMKTIENFKKTVKEKVDLVTADGGFEWNNENIQEQESAILIYAQILTAINIQKKGGNFVLKIFETFTDLSLKFIVILKYFYEEVHIVKPLTSRDSNSERYVVCKKFKYSESQISKLIKKMMDVLDNMHDEKAKFLADCFPDLEISDEIRLSMTCVNTMITNQQFKVINKMIEFIEGSNYHGELYMNYRERQILHSEHWITVFLNDQSDYTKAREDAVKIINTANKILTSMTNDLIKSTIGYNVSDDTNIKKTKQISKTNNSEKSNKKDKRLVKKTKTPKKDS